MYFYVMNGFPGYLALSVGVAGERPAGSQTAESRDPRTPSANPPERPQTAGRPVLCVYIYWRMGYSVKSINSMEVACVSKIPFAFLQWCKNVSEDHLSIFFMMSESTSAIEYAVVPRIRKERPVMRWMLSFCRTSFHMSMSKFLSNVFTASPFLYYHSKVLSSSRVARIRWHIARVESRGACCVGTTTTSPLWRFVLVYGRRTADAFLNFSSVSHSLRQGSRLGIILSIDAGISSPRRICPIQAPIANASACFSRAFPVHQVMASKHIMPGVTGGHCGFCCFSLGQCKFIAHLMACIRVSISNGRPWRLCQSAMAAILAVAVPVPFPLMTSAIVSKALCVSVPDLSPCEIQYLVIISN
jgi:hypothetical protein